ncbi:MAG: MobC family plasmid mobilization relaxosome protein [Plesiomonas sp.]
MTGSGGYSPRNPCASTANIRTLGAKLSQWILMQKRIKEIKIRLTETEHQQLLDRCDRIHLADWLRSVGLGESKTTRRKSLPTVDPLLLRKVSGIGNNLNQIARYLNQCGLSPQERVSLLAVLTSMDTQLTELLELHRDC